jgi:hypothetical protein
MKFNLNILVLLLIFPSISIASDPTGMNIFIFGVILIPIMVITLIVWLIKRKIGMTGKEKTIMYSVYLLFLSPVPWESSGALWPSSFILIVGEIGAKITALGFIAAFGLISFVFSKSLQKHAEDEVKKQNENELELIKVEEEKLKSDIEMKVKK